MMKTAAPLLVAGLLLAGCATDPIQYAGNVSSLPAFHTFKVQEERYVFPEQVPADQKDRVSRELRQAAVSALQSRGYREVGPNDAADVLVVLGAISRTTTETGVEEDQSRHLNQVNTSVFDGNTSEPPAAIDGGEPTGFSREGDLILYLLDPATQRSLWRANASGSASSSGEALRKAKSTYRAMVRQLPQAPGS
jgi:Domain of unknown function (DUF4136)